MTHGGSKGAKPRSGTTQTVCLSLYPDELDALLAYAPDTGDRRARSGATAAVRKLLAIAREAEVRRG